MTNPEGLDSRYRGIRFDARKRYSSGWQLLASLTLSESEGFLPAAGFESSEGTSFATPLYDNPNTLRTFSRRRS